jgi:AcrR family transcriptional regulator
VHPEDEGRKVPARRRRRTPEVAEGEIIAAAETFLRERPFREMTVDEVMRRTDLSRPSFYVYFSDRHQLVLRVVEHLGAELFTMSDRWLSGTGEGPDLARQALHGIVAVYVEHGPVMRALADAAADDPSVEQAYTRWWRRSSTPRPGTSSTRSRRRGSSRWPRTRPPRRWCG